MYRCYVLVSVLVFVLFAGCGGGSGTPSLPEVHLSGTSALASASYDNGNGLKSNFLSFTASRDGQAQATMTSTEVFPKLIVRHGGKTGEVIDSNSPGGTYSPSVLLFSAKKGEQYTVEFTDWGSDVQLGSYTYTIDELTDR